jgi:hypothetical protein
MSSASTGKKETYVKRKLDIGWMSAISHAMILEIFAIFMSRFMIVLFAPHKYVFASFGYFAVGASGAAAAPGSMVFNMLFELCAELTVDWFAVGMEVAKGVPVLDFFDFVTSGSLLGFYISSTLLGFIGAFAGLVTAPSAGLCNTPSSICECLAQLPQYTSLCRNISSSSSANRTLAGTVPDPASTASFFDALGLESVQQVVIAVAALLLTVVILKLAQVFAQMKRARIHIASQDDRLASQMDLVESLSASLSRHSQMTTANAASFTVEEQQLITNAFDPEDEMVELLQS